MQTAPLDIDRTILETSVGRWVSGPLCARLKANRDARLEEGWHGRGGQENKMEDASKKAVAHVGRWLVALLNVADEVPNKLCTDRQAEILDEMVHGRSMWQPHGGTL